MWWHKCKLLLVTFSILLISDKTLAQGLGAGVAVYNSVAETITTAGADKPLTFDSEHWDCCGYHVNTGSEFCVPEGYAGWYTISGNVYWEGNATNNRRLRILLNSSTIIASVLTAATSTANIQQSVSTVYYLVDEDCVELAVYQNSGGDLDVGSISAYSPEFRMVSYGTGGFVPTPMPTATPGVLPHHQTHEDGGNDEINVTGLSGILTDTQDAGWLQGLLITTTAPSNGQALAWSAADDEWQPTLITGTGGYTMPDVITATITGTVPVIITNTYQFTEALSSGHDLAIIRSFTYGEASIAIGLFVVAALLGLHLLFTLQGRN